VGGVTPLALNTRFPARRRPPVTRFHAAAIRTIHARLGRLPDAGPDEGHAVDMLAAQMRRSRIHELKGSRK